MRRAAGEGKKAAGRAGGSGGVEARAMVVAGVMSGTSADGIDVAVCRIAAGDAGEPKLKLLGHTAAAYTPELRAAVLAGMDARRTSTADLARLHWRLGMAYADAVEAAVKACGARLRGGLGGLDLVACHGQTVYHQAAAAEFAGAPVRATWQLGEASVMAERMRVPVVSDFRPADFAAGGQGAPLVPMLDYTLFRHAKYNRVLLNLGGIANMTAMPAGAGAEAVLAFDSGPANMVIDALMQELYGRGFDADGAVAAKGKVLQPVLAAFGTHAFFAENPPKSCGREEFGERFAAKFLATCRKHSARRQDAVATATAFTAETILAAYRRFVWTHLGQRAPLARRTELLAAGGGTRNATLMRMLREGLEPLGVRVGTTDAAGLPAEAKEAAAFALMGWLTWHRMPGNLPAATGAARPVVLGKVTYA